MTPKNFKGHFRRWEFHIGSELYRSLHFLERLPVSERSVLKSGVSLRDPTNRKYFFQDNDRLWERAIIIIIIIIIIFIMHKI